MFTDIDRDDDLLMEAEAFVGEKLRDVEMSETHISATTMDGFRMMWKFDTQIKEVREKLYETRRKQKEMIKSIKGIDTIV